MPALALERVAGCAPGGTLAPCLDSVHTTAEESTTSRQRHVRFKEESDLPWGGAEPPSRNRPTHGKALEG